MRVFQEIIKVHHYCLLDMFGESFKLFGFVPEIGESLAMVFSLG